MFFELSHKLHWDHGLKFQQGAVTVKYIGTAIFCIYKQLFFLFNYFREKIMQAAYSTYRRQQLSKAASAGAKQKSSKTYLDSSQ